MTEMHLRQPGLKFSTCGPFTKKGERMQKNEKTEDSVYIYQNELNKVCFQHVKAYGGFKDLPRKTTADKVLTDKAFNIAKNPKHDKYQCKVASLVHKFFDKKSSGSRIDSELIPHRKLAEELKKTINKKI